MATIGCLFCRRKVILFKISNAYNTGCPIKNYIMDFLGDCEQYLRDDYGMCCKCVYVLNNLLYIKKFMHLIITTGTHDFKKVYKKFMEQLKKLEYEEHITDTEESENKNKDEDGFENDDDLLRPQRSSPWEEQKEAKHNNRNLRNGTPGADREIENVFRGRRGKRKRGHNWTKRKRSQSRMSTFSEPIGRRNLSRVSYINFSEYHQSDRSDEDDDNEENNINSGRVWLDRQNPVIPTKYKCIDDCIIEFDRLSELTRHKMEVHRMLAKYMCYECYRQTFVSPEDLKLHNDLCHNMLISHCLMCSDELRTVNELKAHLEKHRYSCSYCEMAFLNLPSLKNHLLASHKFRRRRQKSTVKTPCINRIIHSVNSSNNTVESGTLVNNHEYDEQIIRRLQKGSSEKNCNSYTDVIEKLRRDTDKIYSNSNRSGSSISYTTTHSQALNENIAEDNSDVHNRDIELEININKINKSRPALMEMETSSIEDLYSENKSVESDILEVSISQSTEQEGNEADTLDILEVSTLHSTEQEDGEGDALQEIRSWDDISDESVIAALSDDVYDDMMQIDQNQVLDKSQVETTIEMKTSTSKSTKNASLDVGNANIVSEEKLQTLEKVSHDSSLLQPTEDDIPADISEEMKFMNDNSNQTVIYKAENGPVKSIFSTTYDDFEKFVTVNNVENNLLDVGTSKSSYLGKIEDRHKS